MAELQQTTSPDYGKGLTWYLKDPRFGNVLLQFSLYILACILIIPIFYVAPLMLGYMVATIRNIQKGEFVLPEIDSNTQWKDGAKLILANLAVGFFFGMITFGLSMLVSLIGNYDSSSSSSYSVLTAGLVMVNSLVNIVVNILLVLLEMLMTIVYAKTGSLNELTIVSNYQEIIRENGSTIIIMLVLLYVVSSVVPMLGLLLCCIGILPASVIVSFITAGLYGQLKTSGVGTSVQQEVVKTAENQ